jgi:hypothetical protein
VSCYPETNQSVPNLHGQLALADGSVEELCAEFFLEQANGCRESRLNDVCTPSRKQRPFLNRSKTVSGAGLSLLPQSGQPLRQSRQETTLARKLQARGHDVVFISVLDTEPYVRAAQLPFIPYCEKEIPMGSVRQTTDQLSKLQGQAALEFSIRSVASGLESSFKGVRFRESSLAFPVSLYGPIP